MLTDREYTSLSVLTGDRRNRPACYLTGDQRVGLQKLLAWYDAHMSEVREHETALEARKQADLDFDAIMSRDFTRGIPGAGGALEPVCPCDSPTRKGHPLRGYCAYGLGGVRG